MKLLRRILLIISVGAVLFTPQLTAAAAPALFQDACGADGSTTSQSAACTATPEPVTGSNGILAKATKIIAMLAGIAAIIMAVVSGLFFVTAEGDPSKMAGARNALIGTVVGLAIVLAATGILKFVLTKVG